MHSVFSNPRRLGVTLYGLAIFLAGNSMKVLMFVSNAFTNDPRVYSEATSLIQGGYEVTVIASRDWQKQNPLRENLGGIEVVRVATPLSPRHGFGGPLWDGFCLILWQWRAYRRALTLNAESRFDVIHCHDLDTLGIGTKLKQKLCLPLIYDAHEIYGYMMTRHFPRWIASKFLWLEKRLVRKVNWIINVAEPQRRYFDSITDKPISLIMNCKPLQSLEYQPPDNEACFIILYIGSLHQGRAIHMLVDAVRELPGVRCIIGGIGTPENVRALEEKCDTVPNVDFIGRVPFDEVIPMTKRADAVFLMVNPQDLNNRMGLGNKQFEAMVCGRPIICTRGTYSGEMTEQEEVGLTVEYNKEALKQGLIKLRDNTELREGLGRNALQAAIREYNWQRQEEKLLDLYESIRPCVS